MKAKSVFLISYRNDEICVYQRMSYRVPGILLLYVTTPALLSYMCRQWGRDRNC